MNIQTLPWLKFGHDSYLVGEFRAMACALAKAAYFELLCFAMKQSPALSIPNNDSVLAGWIGISLKRWLKIKDLVLAQFSLNPDNNRYYSPMLVELYAEQIAQPDASAKAPAAPSPRTAMTGAERVAKHRARKAAQTVTSPVTPAVTRNDDVTASNAPTVTTGGIKGGDLNPDPNMENQKPTTAPARFGLTFDFEPRQSELAELIDKLEIPAHRQTPVNLNRFIAHYQAKHINNSQAEWELLYAKWLQRENDKPTAKITRPANPTPEPAAKPPAAAKPARVADERPQWMIFAERKAAKKQQSFTCTLFDARMLFV